MSTGTGRLPTCRGTTFLGLMIGLALTFLVSSASAQTYKVLYNFTGGNDGANLYAGVTLDRAGNLYGTASNGGRNGCFSYGCGTVFKLTRTRAG